MKILAPLLVLLIISQAYAKYKKSHQRKHTKGRKSNDHSKQKTRQDDSIEAHLKNEAVSSPIQYQFKAMGDKAALVHQAEQQVLTKTTSHDDDHHEDDTHNNNADHSHEHKEDHSHEHNEEHSHENKEDHSHEHKDSDHDHDDHQEKKAEMEEKKKMKADAADTMVHADSMKGMGMGSKSEEKKKAGMVSPAPKKESNEMTNYTLHPVPYNSTFVNASRPLPRRNTPIPEQWDDATLVKQISTYSKKFLRDINDPKQRNKQFLVGKSLYLENNITFDEQPVILQESAPHMTGVNVVQRNYNTQEKADLWRRFNQEEFKDGFKDVMFNGNSSKDYSSVTDVIKGSHVRIRLNNRNTKPLQQVVSEQTDHILDKTLNPIKQVIFTKDKINDITFDDYASGSSDPKRLTGIDGMKVNKDMVREHVMEQEQMRQYAKKDMSKKSIREQALYDYKPSYYGNQYA